MALVWSPLAIPSLLNTAIAFALALVIYATRRGVPQNRAFAIALALNGAVNLVYGWRLFLTDPRDGYAITFVFMILVLLWIPAMLLFLATLRTPLVAPLRRRETPWILATLSLAAIVTLLVRPRLFFEGIRPFAHTTGFEFINGPLWIAQAGLLPIIFLWGFVAAVDVWRRAAPGIGRQRAGTFAVGFGVQNVVMAVGIVYFLLFADLSDPFANRLNFLLVPVAAILSSTIIAYGILRFQLFEIELRLKRSIRTGALGGAFFGVFFVATEGAQVLFEQSVGPLAGLLAAGILVFALHPLQRVADRVADLAMPQVAATPQYLDFRRMQIYREALDSLLADGDVTPKERAALDRLRATLGIGEADALALEADVARSRAG